MRRFVFALLAILAVLHQDFWFWDRIDPLVFGFIPVGLAYHIGISIAAGILWALAVHYCWPKDVDVPDDSFTTEAPSAAGQVRR